MVASKASAVEDYLAGGAVCYAGLGARLQVEGEEAGGALIESETSQAVAGVV